MEATPTEKGQQQLWKFQWNTEKASKSTEGELSHGGSNGSGRCEKKNQD